MHQPGGILINILHEEQDKSGYISEKALKRISLEQGIPIARLYGVVKFYSKFRCEPQGKNVIEVCSSPSCVLNKSGELEKVLEKETGAKTGGTGKDGLFSLYKSPCIDCCKGAPAILANGKACVSMNAGKARLLVKKLRSASKRKAKKRK